MGAIFIREFSTGPAPYLTLAGEEYVRPLGIGNNWSVLRVVILYAVTPNGTSDIGNIYYGIGLCSGTSRTYASGDCQHAVMANAARNGTLTYVVNGGFAFYSISGGTGAVQEKVVNGSVTTGASAPLSVGLIGTRRSVFVATFTKGSPNFTLGAAAVSAGAGANFGVDQTFRHGIEWCDPPATSVIITLNGVTTTLSGTNQTLAVSESDGPLDTLNLYWNKVQFPLEIYGIFVARQS